jgi:choline dehydrogenase-like flavoprotein
LGGLNGRCGTSQECGGTDPKTSVLNTECRAHDVENLYVTDGSFMPTGGSVPYTWTIYANAFRVADRIKEELS